MGLQGPSALPALICGKWGRGRGHPDVRTSRGRPQAEECNLEARPQLPGLKAHRNKAYRNAEEWDPNVKLNSESMFLNPPHPARPARRGSDRHRRKQGPALSRGKRPRLRPGAEALPSEVERAPSDAGMPSVGSKGPVRLNDIDLSEVGQGARSLQRLDEACDISTAYFDPSRTPPLPRIIPLI